MMMMMMMVASDSGEPCASQSPRVNTGGIAGYLACCDPIYPSDFRCEMFEVCGNPSDVRMLPHRIQGLAPLRLAWYNSSKTMV